MTCLPGSIATIDEWTDAVRRCAVEYGGPHWESTAMLGGAVVLVAALGITVLFLTLRGIRR